MFTQRLYQHPTPPTLAATPLTDYQSPDLSPKIRAGAEPETDLKTYLVDSITLVRGHMKLQYIFSLNLILPLLFYVSTFLGI